MELVKRKQQEGGEQEVEEGEQEVEGGDQEWELQGEGGEQKWEVVNQGWQQKWEQGVEVIATDVYFILPPPIGRRIKTKHTGLSIRQGTGTGEHLD